MCIDFELIVIIIIKIIIMIVNTILIIKIFSQSIASACFLYTLISSD